MDTNRHNGYRNYPTWAINLWMSNEAGLYSAAREMARASTHYKDGNLRLSGTYKNWIKEMIPTLDGFPGDLLNYALEQVDWHEIAQEWIEDYETIVT